MRARSGGGILIAAATALVAVACGGDDGPRRWVVANVHPESYPTAAALRFLADGIAKEPALAGVALDLQLGGVLGGEKESLEKLRFGAIQAVCTSAAPLAEFAPAIGVLTLPYLFRDEAHLWTALEGPLGRELLATLEPSGFVGLAWYDAGSRSFYDRERPIRTPADLRGLKIRVQQSGVMRQTVEALGGTPVALGFKEVYTALHTGAIDGAENNLPSYRSERHFEVARYYGRDRHATIPDLLVVGKPAWDALSPAEQEALRRLAAASTAFQRERWRAYEAEAETALAAAGAVIEEAGDLAPFRAAVEPLYAELAPRYGDWVERLRAAR